MSDPRKPNFVGQSNDHGENSDGSMNNCIVVRSGKKSCKRRAPFALSSVDWIDENGAWGPRRMHVYFNNWCPPLLLCLQQRQMQDEGWMQVPERSREGCCTKDDAEATHIEVDSAVLQRCRGHNRKGRGSFVIAAKGGGGGDEHGSNIAIA
jgi:hypothetical protein